MLRADIAGKIFKNVWFVRKCEDICLVEKICSIQYDSLHSILYVYGKNLLFVEDALLLGTFFLKKPFFTITKVQKLIEYSHLFI